ncbi:wax ester/triacylglycerol synthase domain-containing protein [Actinotalea sp. K2]|uniref:wax ester/triacylglycerol synthase domain-containing protein n=1 Tax=Actinotalea sp. K2 TaxID=2939438 RepID=UPI00201832D7|nr:wax ester/triacylglycerol synthase domain-containing protein [Actinotalea sp. K2]MCL3862468.1 WS/DGAT domain-containing protein [Actinotalea sp. K2]
MGNAPVDRLSAADVAELATDSGPVPTNVGVLLVCGAAPGVDAATLEAALMQRMVTVARLRQRLERAPWGLGRPFWVDDGSFEVAKHVSRVACPAAAATDATVVAAAVQVVTTPLPMDRPLWRATVLTGLPGGALGVVVVMHHVLADGIGGLSVLARLVDPGADRGVDPGVATAAGQWGPPAPPRPAPGPTQLLVDVTAERLRRVRGALRRVPRALARLRRGRSELVGQGRPEAAPRCSLNAPTGPRRHVVVVEVDLSPLRAAGRRHGATVNDLLLVAVTGAMGHVLAVRGEHPQALVVPVPVSARTSTTDRELGNRTGVMPVRVPLHGSTVERLAAVSRVTRARKAHVRGDSAALVRPVFRLLAATGAFGWFVNRQRLVNSFLTNLPGPVEPLSLAGAPVLRTVPLTPTAGNVGVAFAALSCAGTLTVSVVTDPDIVPEADALAAALHHHLTTLTHL